MAREIKFRAWDGEKMDYDPVQCTDGPETTTLNGNIQAMFKDWHQPGYKALMQFTGLKDKNGKEIYEGDIVRCDYFSNVNPLDHDDNNYLDACPRIGQIHWNNTYAKWECHGESVCRMDENHKMEVIGNIYQRPDY